MLGIIQGGLNAEGLADEVEQVLNGRGISDANDLNAGVRPPLRAVKESVPSSNKFPYDKPSRLITLVSRVLESSFAAMKMISACRWLARLEMSASARLSVKASPGADFADQIITAEVAGQIAIDANGVVSGKFPPAAAWAEPAGW